MGVWAGMPLNLWMSGVRSEFGSSVSGPGGVCEFSASLDEASSRVRYRNRRMCEQKELSK